jgi:mRNA interferase MazF
VNASQLSTVVVCVLTNNKAHARAPGNTLLKRRDTGLARDSVASASQIATVDKEDLDELVGHLPPAVLHAVCEGVRWFLDLGD